MATTKEYNDLNTASSVDNTSKIAIAQPNKEELETTTVSALAEKVATVIEYGAMSELTNAVSNGKKMLAQRLVEKGSQGATQNETLIQMADRLNNLIIDSQKTNLIGNIVCPTEAKTLSGTRSPMSFKFLKNNYFVLAAYDTLYLVKFGQYKDLEDLIASAVSSVKFQNIPSSTCLGIGRSNDGNTVICKTIDAHLEIFDINYETETISFVKEITTSSSFYGDSGGLSISNDRSLFVNHADYIYLVKVDDTTQKAELHPNNQSVIYDSLFDEENNTIYFTNGDLIKVVYSVSDASITRVSYSIISTGFRGFFLPEEKCHIVINGDTAPTAPVLLRSPSIIITELLNNFNQVKLDLKILPNIVLYTSSGPLYETQATPLGRYYFPVTKEADGTYKLFVAGLEEANITYNPIEHSLSVSNNVYVATPNKLLNSSSDYYPWTYLFYTSDKKAFFLVQTSSLGTSGFKGTRYSDSQIYTNKLLGQEREINGNTIQYLLPYFPEDAVKAGAYDLETSVVKLE